MQCHTMANGFYRYPASNVGGCRSFFYSITNCVLHWMVMGIVGVNEGLCAILPANLGQGGSYNELTTPGQSAVFDDLPG
jgi:hypothetical protein